MSVIRAVVPLFRTVSVYEEFFVGHVVARRLCRSPRFLPVSKTDSRSLAVVRRWILQESPERNSRLRLVKFPGGIEGGDIWRRHVV